MIERWSRQAGGAVQPSRLEDVLGQGAEAGRDHQQVVAELHPHRRPRDGPERQVRVGEPVHLLDAHVGQQTVEHPRGRVVEHPEDHRRSRHGERERQRERGAEEPHSADPALQQQGDEQRDEDAGEDREDGERERDPEHLQEVGIREQARVVDESDEAAGVPDDVRALHRQQHRLHQGPEDEHREHGQCGHEIAEGHQGLAAPLCPHSCRAHAATLQSRAVKKAQATRRSGQAVTMTAQAVPGAGSGVLVPGADLGAGQCVHHGVERGSRSGHGVVDAHVVGV